MSDIGQSSDSISVVALLKTLSGFTHADECLGCVHVRVTTDIRTWRNLVGAKTCSGLKGLELAFRSSESQWNVLTRIAAPTGVCQKARRSMEPCASGMD